MSRETRIEANWRREIERRKKAERTLRKVRAAVRWAIDGEFHRDQSSRWKEELASPHSAWGDVGRLVNHNCKKCSTL